MNAFSDICKYLTTLGPVPREYDLKAQAVFAALEELVQFENMNTAKINATSLSQPSKLTEGMVHRISGELKKRLLEND